MAEVVMTLGSHQQCVGQSQDHITPPWIIDRLGPFDLDPAAAEPRPWDCAEVNWAEHGLDRNWFGLVYLNPPFDRYQVGHWIARLAEHGNGITLLHARTEAAWFEPIWRHAAAILFLADRIHFHRPDGTRQPANSGAPPLLAAFGETALERIRRSGIAGALVTGWRIQGAPFAPLRQLLPRVADAAPAEAKLGSSTEPATKQDMCHE
jgi:hypothetical protein